MSRSVVTVIPAATACIFDKIDAGISAYRDAALIDSFLLSGRRVKSQEIDSRGVIASQTLSPD